MKIRNRIKTGIQYSKAIINTLIWWNKKTKYSVCNGDCKYCIVPHCPCFSEISKEDIIEYLEARKLIEDYYTNS